MALSAYNGETDRLNGVYNAYSADRNTEANEWSNNWNVYNQLYSQYYNQFSDMLNKDMSAWQQKGSNLYNAANLASSQYNTASSNDISTWSTGENMRAEQASQEEAERVNRIQEAYQNAQLAETIRANKVQEQYNRDKLNADKTVDSGGNNKKSTVSGKTDRAKSYIKQIENTISNIVDKKGINQRAAFIDSLYNNGSINESEWDYLYSYFSL